MLLKVTLVTYGNIFVHNTIKPFKKSKNLKWWSFGIIQSKNTRKRTKNQ